MKSSLTPRKCPNTELADLRSRTFEILRTVLIAILTAAGIFAFSQEAQAGARTRVITESVCKEIDDACLRSIRLGKMPFAVLVTAKGVGIDQTTLMVRATGSNGWKRGFRNSSDVEPGESIYFEADAAEIGNWLDMDDGAVSRTGFEMRVRLRTTKGERVVCSKIKYQTIGGSWHFYDDDGSRWTEIPEGGHVTGLQRLLKPRGLSRACD